jgi:ketosteroid isomerase-like protein
MIHRPAFALALALGLAALAAGPARADEATDLANAFLEKGAAAFEKKNLAEVVAQYLDDGQLFVVIKDANSGSVEVQSFSGRTEIEGQYRKLFESDDPFYARNEAHYARLIAPDMLMVAGTFHVAVGQGKPLAIPFVQVREKRGDAWKVRSMRVFIIPGA